MLGGSSVTVVRVSRSPSLRGASCAGRHRQLWKSSQESYCEGCLQAQTVGPGLSGLCFLSRRMPWNVSLIIPGGKNEAVFVTICSTANIRKELQAERSEVILKGACNGFSVQHHSPGGQCQPAKIPPLVPKELVSQRFKQLSLMPSQYS